MWTYNTTPFTELYHYGVKGMKWGVRKKINPSTSVIGAFTKKDVGNKKDFFKKSVKTSLKKDNHTSNFNRKNNNKNPIVNEINVHTGFAVYKKHAKKRVSSFSDEALDFINEGKKRARSLVYLY